MSFEFNPFTGKLDFVGAAGSSSSELVGFWLNSLRAYDKILSVQYLDIGLRVQRISTITFSSVSVPDANVTAQVFWLDVGTMNQRIEKIAFSGAPFSPQTLEKTFAYSLQGFKYVREGHSYQIV